MISTIFIDCEPADSGTSFCGLDKQQPKLTPLRDSQNENRISSPRPLGIPPFRTDRESFMDAATGTGRKRPASDCLQDFLSNQPSITNGVDGHHVYARRKIEQDLLPININTESPKSTECRQQGQQKQVDSESTLDSCILTLAPPSETSQFPAKPPNEMLSGEFNRETNMVEVSHHCSLQKSSDQHWNHRYLQLLDRLRSIDGAKSQATFKRLQRLTPALRSKHAIALEKRAIQLVLEEENEIARMKNLNILRNIRQ